MSLLSQTLEVRSSLMESQIAVTPEYVAKLRKDFLTLVKNSQRIKEASDLDRFRTACVTYSNYLDKILEIAKEELNNVKFRAAHAEYLNRQKTGTWADSRLETDAESLLKDVKYLSRFSNEIGGPPGSSRQFFDKYHAELHGPDKARQDAAFVSEFTRYAKEWEARTRRAAPKAWRWLEDVATVVSKGSESGALVVDDGSGTLMSLEGFRVRLDGFDGGKSHVEYLNNFKNNLRLFKDAAKRRLPLMLKDTPAFILSFKGSGDASYAGQWEADHVTISIWGMSDTMPGRGAKTVAHEVAHGIWYQTLSDEARKAWEHFVQGETVDLDLRQVLKDIGENGMTWDSEVYKDDPLQFLRVSSLNYDRTFHFEYGRDIKKWLDAGNESVIRVARLPITAYAAKNPMEAFCEALSMNVIYGSKAVLPEVRQMLRILLPGLRSESWSSEVRELRNVLVETGS